MSHKNTSTLIERMEQISSNYFKAKEILKNKQMSLSDTNFHNLCSYIHCVHSSYAKLKFHEKQFLNNEFFHGAYAGWWKASLTPTQFNNIQNQSISHFLKNFYENI